MRGCCAVVVVAAACAALVLAPDLTDAQQPTAPPAPAPSAAAPAFAATLGAVDGVVYDSLTRRPLAGAIVQIVRASDLLGSRAATADTAGAFRIDSLTPGRYLVGFDHPLLDVLGIAVTPRLVDIERASDAVRLALGVPDLAGVRPAVCGNPQAPADSSGLLAGRVRDAADDAPVANARVVLTWTELAFEAGGVRTERRRVPVTTGPGGRYAVCGVPAGVELVASAAAPGRASGDVAVAVPPRGLTVRDLVLGDTAAVTIAGNGDTAVRPAAAVREGVHSASAPLARGTARLTGTVRDAGGRPVRGARATVHGTAAATATGADGTFTLSGLPAGTRTLEVRAIGYTPGRVTVDLAAGRAGTADVRMERLTTLDPVTVFGTPSQRLRDFLDRRRHSAYGRFITTEELERWKPATASAVLSGVPGVRVVPNGGVRTTIIGRGPFGPCQALLVLDGAVLPPGDGIDLHVGARQLAGVEVYADAMFAPVYYGTAGQINACSVVLFWTR